MYLTDIDVRIAEQRYQDQLQRARLLRLLRELNARERPSAAPPASRRSLAGRVWAALFAREPATALRRRSI